MTDPASLDVRGYQLGEFHLDLGKRRLVAPDGAAVAISARAYDVLVYLVTHRDRVVERNELLKAVWPQSVVEDNNLDQAPQYVARPPDKSNTAPVENEHSSDASQQTSDAISSTVPKRPIGIFDNMKSMCCCVI